MGVYSSIRKAIINTATAHQQQLFSAWWKGERIRKSCQPHCCQVLCFQLWECHRVRAGGTKLMAQHRPLCSTQGTGAASSGIY